MTEADYIWLTNDRLPDNPVIKVVAGSQWHYAQGGWVETDPVPELTAADIEAAEEPQPELVYDVPLEDVEAAPEEEAEQDTEPEPSDQEESE